MPDVVREQIAERVGGSRVFSAAGGDHAEIAATVAGGGGSVFVKAARSGLGVRSLRYELRVGEGLEPPHSPAVLWHFEASGWLVAGFEQLDGRHADLSPDSTDLGLLSAAIEALGVSPEPGVELFSPSARLGFSHPAMDGSALVHTDLNPANLIVTSAGLRIVDWAFATRAAPWLELAMLVPWLIGGGHTPERAESWLARFPAWGLAGAEVLDDFARKNAAKWSAKAQADSAPWIHDLAAWTGRWARFRD